MCYNYSNEWFLFFKYLNAIFLDAYATNRILCIVTVISVYDMN